MKNQILWSRPMLAVLFLAWGPGLQAHPGHDLLDHGARHVLLSPYHLAVLSLAGLALLGAAQFVSKRGMRNALGWSGAALLAVAGFLWTLNP